MQIIGIYVNEANKDIKKTLEQKWFAFCKINPEDNSVDNLDKLNDIFHKKLLKYNSVANRLELIKDFYKFKVYQEFDKEFYGYQDKQIFISAIVGKNGSGKSTLLDIYNRIINNFAAKIKNEFNENNQEYIIEPEPGLNAELYYEMNQKIYCIQVKDNIVDFLSEEIDDVFAYIKKNFKTNQDQLTELSNHIFYTITSNYSLYTGYPEWMSNLYHKNDGYFTPIVLVPYRSEGNIEIDREQKLAEKRVQTLSLLMYKFGDQDKKDFIENYIPTKIKYKLKTPFFFDEQEIYNEKGELIKNYEDFINDKIIKLQKYHKQKNAKIKKIILTQKSTKNKPKILLSDRKFSKVKEAVIHYWDNEHEPENIDIYDEYCKPYLKYKTLKSIVNYETITKKVKFGKGSNVTNIKTVIEDNLLNDKELNYKNLKIVMCMRFIRYTYEQIYKQNSKKLMDGKIQSIPIDKILNKIPNITNNYHEMFSYLLPDFFDAHFFYKKTNEGQENIQNKNRPEEIELATMSSGEQHLYTSLSYIIYHIKNAQSNENDTSEGKIPYKNFNVFFDEAEIYYHPEYQRKLIRNIIKLLNRCDLRIDGLNLSLVTHSPFILSDIPRNSILALEDGIVSTHLNETLGANIYDLLENQFFMSSTIGEMSKSYIEKIIKDCNEKNIIDEQTYKVYNNFVSLLGDTYIKTILEKKINQKRNSTDIQKQIEYYNKKIDQLKLLEKTKNEEN